MRVRTKSENTIVKKKIILKEKEYYQFVYKF